VADRDWADKKAIEVFRETDGCVGLGDMADALRQARLDALEEAAKICEKQQAIFRSVEYAALQPHSSFAERFACGRCAENIRLLKEEAP